MSFIVLFNPNESTVTVFVWKNPIENNVPDHVLFVLMLIKLFVLFV